MFPMLLLLWALWSLPPDAAAAPLPLVVLPPFFRPNATNSIVVAAAKSKYDVVDIHIEIRSFKGNEASVVLVEKLRSKKAGVPNSVSFHLADNVENAELTVSVQGHDRFYTHVRVSPDVAALHLQTDKPAYRAGETVSIRALPLTYDGSIFDGVIEFCLVNPNGFELVRKRNRTNAEGYIALQFELPTHLLYGQWHVLATPMPVNKHVRAEHKVEFLVKDYALPSFKILTTVREGQPLSSTEITVQARYFHGAPVSGTLLLSCSVPRHNLIENKPIQILQSYVHDGKWRQSVNLSSCFTHDLRQSTVILVQIRDRGTGSRTDAATVFDPLAAGFEIVPLRPVFGAHTRHILLVTHPTVATPGSMLNVTIECLGEVRRPTVLAKVPLGDVLNVVKPDEWAQCHVIMIQASRIVGTAASRTKVLLHPSVVGLSSVEPSWIEVCTAKPVYLVGEKFVVTVPGSVLQSLNYIVTCNTHTPIVDGQVVGNGEISIEVKTAMVGTCMLVVYSTGPKAAADVVQFKVDEHCEVSAVASKTNISPGSHLSLTMIGKPLGMTFLHAIDGRLNTLKAVNAGPAIKYVDFGIFAHPEMLDNQMQLVNFVDRSKLKETLEQNCASSSLFYYERHGSCPDVRISQSALSNYCFRVMAAACLNKQQPEVAVSTICDLRNPRTCGLHLKKVMSFPRSRLIQTFEDTAAKPFSDISNALGEEEVMVRERFHEVWLFDIVPLGPSGTVSRTVEAPHNVGSWSVALGFWGPGQRELCPAGVEISATKEVFMEIDLPKYAFVNETVTAMVSVTSLNPMEEIKYSVCLSELSRRVCADLGSYGQLGQPTYSRVVVSPSRPTDTKTFPVRFLSTGLSSVTFVLREERSYPGKHHCDIGDIKDQVRLKVQIAQRDETDEIYKRIVLDMSKPSLSFLSNGMVYAPKAEHFYVEKKRSPRNTDVLIADVHTGIPDAGAVYSFSVDISKFLDDHASKSTDRARRDADVEHVFLSDVIKSLSVELYQLKGIKKQPQHNDLETDMLQNRIGSLISDMLRFSDCKNESSCGYAEFGSPSKPRDRSIAFTAIATSLLCEAGSSRRLVCGGINFLLQSVVENWLDDRVDLREIMDMVHPIDREWFLKSLLLQVSRDCAAYQCGKDEEAWYKLIASFYSLDEGRKWDLRSLAALAFMGTNATSEIMRIRLASMTNGNVLPFWNAGLWTLPQSSRSAGVGGASWYRKIKSGDVLVNSLGILAYVSLGAEPRNINWDPLANWIYEQQLQDGTFENAIDTYFAARALYEYRLRRVPSRTNDDLKVTVRCPSCEPFTVNLTESATEIHLPTTARNVTLESEGHGKVNVGFRILTKKRLRSRRGLSQDDYYPVRIDVHQERVARGTMRQIVCLRVLSPAITTMEITHGLFTGYSATPENIGALTNSTQLSFVTPPTVSSFAVHALLEGFQHDKTLCYALGVTEPGHSHEPLHLAPVAITARHPTEGVVGLALISHPDQGRRSHRARRHSQSKPTCHLTCRYPFLKRIRRSLIDESIDTVCYQGGSCSCAESTCGVKCGVCAADVLSSLEDQVLKAKNFGALLRVLAVQRVLVVNAFYTKISMDVREKRGGAATKISEKLEVWLRDCNPRCISAPPSVGDKFLMIGDAEALSVDSLGRQQYVLRNTDRFEKATSACGVLSNVIILG